MGFSRFEPAGTSGSVSLAAPLCGAAGLLLSLGALAPYVIHSESFLVWASHGAASVAATGVGLLLGSACLLVAWLASEPLSSRVQTVLAAAITVRGLAGLAEQLFHVDLGIDLPTLHAAAWPQLHISGRMSGFVALSLVFYGVHVFAYALLRGPRGRLLGRAMLVGVVVLALVSLCLFALGLQAPDSDLNATGFLGMSLLTAIGLLLLSVGGWSLWSDAGGVEFGPIAASETFQASALVLVATALATGLIGLGLLQSHAEPVISSNLGRTFLLIAVCVAAGVFLLFRRVRPLVAELNQSEEYIRNLALHDVLTGLPNRALLDDRFLTAARMADRNHAQVAALMIDLDRFKQINDTLGHHIGDLLLQEVAHRIQSSIRASDTAARIGGDEFVLLLPDSKHPEGPSMVASKLIEVLSQPISIGESAEITVTPSIGIAAYPVDGSDLVSVLRCADTAMYAAKFDGRSTFRVFDSQRLAPPAPIEPEAAREKTPSR